MAEEHGEIVGWAETEFEWSSDVDDVAETWAFVRPDRRRRGLGAMLHDRAVEHALAHRARELRSGSWEDVGRRFLEQRGYRASREERMSAVDPRTVDTSALETAFPDGFRVVPLAELRGRERDVHALYTEAAADMPADHPQTNLPFEEWVEETLGIPELSWEGSAVVLAGETPAALAFINVDLERRRAEHELTGTARAFRRRGLARAAKLATVRWCAEHGIERLATGNDATNEGMLAINRALGYEPWVTWVEYVRER